MTKRTLTSIEIPQADSLENVRRVVAAIAAGATARKEIAERTDISVRHIDYAIHAAKSLGFLVSGEALSITDTGTALAGTARGSAEEREQLRAAIRANEVVGMLAPDLLDDAAPSKPELTKRIQEACPDLSEATAARRAQTLLAWRAQALSTQVWEPIEDEPAAPAAEEPAEAAPAAPPPAKKPAARKATRPAAKKPAAKKPAAKKAAAKKPAAKKAAPAKKAAAKKPAAKKPAPAKKAAKKAAPAKKTAKKAVAKKPAAKKAAPARKAAAAAPAEATAAVAAPPTVEAAPPPAAAEAPAREVTYEMDPGSAES